MNIPLHAGTVYILASKMNKYCSIFTTVCTVSSAGRLAQTFKHCRYSQN